MSVRRLDERHEVRNRERGKISSDRLTNHKRCGIVLETKETVDKEITSTAHSQRAGDGGIRAEMRIGKWTLEGPVKGNFAE